MKKAISILLCAAMVLSLASCKAKDTKDTTESVGDSESMGMDESIEVTSQDTDSTEPEESQDAAGSRATSELFNGAYAIDDNYENPDVFDWHTYTESGGSLTLVDEDGQMTMYIETPGSLKHSCQVYKDGFAIYQNAEYQVEFDIYSDIERDFEWRIQMNGGDYHAYYVEEAAHMGTEPTHISAVFTMYEPSDPAPRFAFNLGAQGDLSDTQSHTIYIDNLTMLVLNSDNAVDIEPLPEPNHISIDQIGYQTKDPKAVFVNGVNDTEFEIVNAETGEVVYTGALSDPKRSRGAGVQVQQGDFSDFTEPGTYFIRTANEGESYKFTIADDVYDEALRASILMLYTQRCGCEVTADIGDAYADFVHPECHTSEAVIYGTDQTIDVSGGWHDAGDYGRYVVPGAKTVADLFMTYLDTGYDADDLGIPESGNGVPDVLDEARYELEWMLKMQAENGGVYHKVTCENFPATVMPQEETATLLVLPISTTATGDFAAVMAKAYVVYKGIDKEFADKCLEASKKAYAYMEENAAADTTGFLNPSDVATGEYPDEKNTDEFFWAAIELYLATGESKYLDKAKELYTDKMELGLGWIEMGLYGIYSYLRADASLQTDADFTQLLTDRIISKVDSDLMIAEREGYWSAMGANYPWGSNLTVSNNGILYYLAYLITGEESYRNLSNYQVDYILGMNVTGYSFLTCFGENSAQHPHHRPSQFIGHAVPGMVVGGPNGDPADPYAISVLYGLPAAKCYVDNDTCYSINEVAIYWNSPFIYILSAKAND
ncbi:MAG: glycoside hydrolase family 9 protein [Clostridiales bacterium]|nr:glycoside hydrolase family 9 protein [Clostridiales bacterium]